MSRRVKAPNTQKRFTNIGVVHLKVGGKKFEIAVYPGKIEDWRRKVETDLDEVLQTRHVYANVAKGEIAKAGDLQAAFGTKDQTKILKRILEEGEVQVSGKERQQSLSVLFKDVATLIVEKCINSETKQSLTIGQVETAMKESHVALDPNKSAKQQALKIIKLLEEKSSLPIERAKMRLQIDVSEEVMAELDNYSKELEVENKMVLKQGEGLPTVLRLTVVIVPSFYRDLDLKVKEKGGKVEVLVHSVKPESIQVF